MDSFLIKKIYEKFTDSPDAATEAKPKEKEKDSYVGLIIAVIVLVSLGGWAAMLSWKANSLVGWNVFAKVFYALFAFLFGFSYLFSYLIYKWDLVNFITAPARVGVI